MPDPADAPPSLRGLDLEAHLRDPRRKQRFVTPMFEIIAPRYDRFTRLFSFGMDAAWKAELVERAVPLVAAGDLVLDLACGTGDLALAIAARRPGARVVGIDAARRMIEEARRRAASAGLDVEFRVGDMTALDAADGSTALVTSGYGFRNVPDHRAALREVGRVLRPGGHVLTLDFYRPESPLWRVGFLGYLAAAGNLVGWLWHREPVVYGYIARSIEHFVSARRFAADLDAAGMTTRHVSRWLLGGVALHEARRDGR